MLNVKSYIKGKITAYIKNTGNECGNNFIVSNYKKSTAGVIDFETYDQAKLIANIYSESPASTRNKIRLVILDGEFYTDINILGFEHDAPLQCIDKQENKVLYHSKNKVFKKRISKYEN